MELKTYFAQDAAGNIISSAVVSVFLQGTNTLATGLTRADGTPLENPFAADGAGRIQFRAPDGYYDIQVSSGSGIIQTLTIQCVDYSGAKADADRAEDAADRADVSAEQVADAVALRGDLAAPSGAGLVYFTPHDGASSSSVEDYLRGSTELIPGRLGFFADSGGVNLHRLRDRVMIGEAAQYTGNRQGVNGYGDEWIAKHAASWIIKNSILASATDDGNAGIGILGASRTAAGVTPTFTNCGVAGLTLNEGSNTFGRAFYGEVMHKSSNGTTVGLEIQGGNYTSRVPVANAYSMGNSVVNGLMIGMESGNNYTVGDGDTTIPLGSNPGGAGIDFCSGSLFANFQKWTVGIVCRDQALLRDSNGMAVAMSMAQKQSLNWEINGTNTGAKLWSEVADPATPVGLRFINRRVQALGANNRIVVDMLDDTTGAGAVNYPVLKNSRTGVNIALGATGGDVNAGVDIYSQGAGSIRLMSHGGSADNLRIIPPASAPVNFLTIAGAVSSGPVVIGSAGADTDIDIRLSPKGSGVVRLGSWTSNADAAVNGYITIKDAGGTTRKLATIA